MKNPVGRPTKYKPEFCDLVIEVGSIGGWLCEMAEVCDVHRSTMDEWASKHPEFSEALMRAKQKAQAWFERTGREAMFADKFNSSLWQKQMSSRHPDEYTEKRENKTDLTSGGEKIGSILSTLQHVEKDKLPEDKTFDTIDKS